MEKKNAQVATPNSVCTSAKKRQSVVKSKNMEGEKFLSAVESDIKESNIENKANIVTHEDDIQSVGTPKKRMRAAAMSEKLLQTPKSSSVSEIEHTQTPRRSARKSIKPAQDYEDIVAKMSLRSMKKEEIEEEEDEEKNAHKWTPAKVGRVSEKRKSRKSRRNLSEKKTKVDEHINVEEEVLEVIANDEDENKENVEPLEQLKNRKSPKDSESKPKTSRRSNEILGLKPNHIEEPKTDLKTQYVESVGKETDKTALQAEVENFKNMNTFAKRRSGDISLSELGLAPMDAEDATDNSTSGNTGVNESPEIFTPEKSELEDNTSDTSTCIIISPCEASDIQAQQQVSNVDNKSTHSIEMVEIHRISMDAQTIHSKVVHEEHIDIIPIDGKKEAQLKRNSSDCEIISPEMEANTQELATDLQNTTNNCTFEASDELTESYWNLPTLLISDDEENDKTQTSIIETENCDNNQQSIASKLPKIVINDQSLVSPIVNFIAKNNKKVTLVSPRLAGPTTLKSKLPKPYRFLPTPYKFTAGKHVPKPLPQVGHNSAQKKQVADLNLTTLSSKEIVLRRIRKRSFSECTEAPTRKPNSVKFHSPLNQTTFIDELDELIFKSTKGAVKRAPEKSRDLNSSNVTQRRKRSLSADESMMQQNLMKRGHLTPSKKISAPQKALPRLKIPNFAAIHKRQFNKMENVVDHVMRKAERANELINSSAKKRSAQKSGFSNENVGLAEDGCSSAADRIRKLRLNKPAALKKIDLSDNEMNLAAPLRSIVPDKDNSEDDEKSTACNLPNPYLIMKMAVVKPMAGGKSVAVATKKTFNPSHQQQEHHTLHSNNQPKPRFNLYTTVSKNETCSLLKRAEAQAAAATAKATDTTSNLNTAAQSPNKMAARRQRHMDMFKGRGAIGRTASNKDKSAEIIRGVRSNRRFELQMQHRKNLTQDHI